MPGPLRPVELPQLPLDDLLAELQGRLSSVLTARDRIRSLLEAVLAIGGDLDLQAVLHRITEVAARLVDAQYAALGVISADGQGLAQFLVVGVDQEMVERIGSLPAGHGVLGQLIRDPRPLRLDNLADHPESFGFPPNHPTMHTFLGVPIRVRDAVFGNLYLTEKRGGAFDEDDEAIVLALAAAAGVAIQNARLYSESRQRERWLVASSEVSTALLSGEDPEQVLALVATRALDVTGASTAFIALPVDGQRLLIEVAEGRDAEAVRGSLLDRGATRLGAVLAGAAPGVIPAAELPGTPSTGEGLAVPLGGTAQQARGVLVVSGLAAGETALATRALGSFAAQAAVALELAERRRDAERFAVFEDRDRIARDLHDLVIQRLFATGMKLEAAVRLMDGHPQESAGRVRQAVDDLDSTIRELRSTIYGLQAPHESTSSLRALLLQAVDAGAEQLGFAPSLRMEGLLDTAVPAPLAAQLLAALREALSNAARHAAARLVDIRVQVSDDHLVLEVVDDGVGMAGDGRRSGLANLAARAAQLGGRLDLESAPGRGTRLTWSVPVSEPAAPGQPA